MTLAQVHNPSSPIKPGELDAYLANAWFRMGQTIFTTHVLHYNGSFYSAVWLRVRLKGLAESSTFKKLKKTNRAFRITFQPATLNAEKEVLFEKYKQSISFEAASSLDYLLFGKQFSSSVYNTYEVTLHDGDQLIATGFFDLGKESGAGISCFYDPDYKKYSLGKYLIYLKTEYCQQLGLRYFYPGYFVPGYSLFDYKLEIGKSALQYYWLEKHQWLPIDHFSTSSAPLENMRGNLSLLAGLLIEKRMPVHLFHYEFYNANLTPEFNGLDLFDFPVFLYCFEVLDGYINPMVVFDIRDQHYHLVQCESLAKTDFPLVKGENYASHLLKIRRYVYSTNSVQEMATQLLALAEALKKSNLEK